MYVIITFSSVTTAKRVERALTDANISCHTMHTPKIISQYGCSHSVRVSKENTEKAVKLCKEMGAKINGIYLEKTVGKGKTEYEKIN
jgi:hypothetical protein